MSRLKFFTSLTVAYQIFFFLGFYYFNPGVSFAYTAQILKDSDSGGNTPIIAIIDFGGKAPDENVRMNIVDTVRNTFINMSNVKPVSEKAIMTYIVSRQQGDRQERIIKLRKAYKLLKDGKRAYMKLDFKEAIERIQLAKKELINNMNELKNNKALLASYLYLGMAYAASGNHDDAYAEFKKVLYLDPKKHLTTKKYSPAIVKAFERAKQDMSKVPKGTVLIDTVPTGCNVFINAKDYGQSPINAVLPVGEYFVKVQKEGYLDWYQLISVEDKVNSLDIEIYQIMADEELVMALRPVLDSNRIRDPESKETLRDAAKKLSADIILLGWIERDARDILLAQMYDTRTEKLSYVIKGNLGKSFSNVDNGVRRLVADLNSYLDEKGLVVAGEEVKDDKIPLVPQPTPLTPAQIKKKKSKEWYNKWWVWALIGGFVAGAGYGIYRGVSAGGSTSISVDNRGNF